MGLGITFKSADMTRKFLYSAYFLLFTLFASMYAGDFLHLEKSFFTKAAFFLGIQTTRLLFKPPFVSCWLETRSISPRNFFTQFPVFVFSLPQRCCIHQLGDLNFQYQYFETSDMEQGGPGEQGSVFNGINAFAGV